MVLRCRLHSGCLFQVTSLSRSQAVGSGAVWDGELFCDQAE